MTPPMVSDRTDEQGFLYTPAPLSLELVLDGFVDAVATFGHIIPWADRDHSRMPSPPCGREPAQVSDYDQSY